MDLSVAIVSWNTSNLLDQCLSSIFETTTGIEYEVIVVDNASSDDSVEMVRAKYPQVRIIANKDNAGFARANNQAYSVNSGRYFMLLNPDILVHSGLHRAVKFLDKHPEAAVVGCKSFNPDGSIQVSWNHYYPSLSSELIPGIFKSRSTPDSETKTADRIFPAAWVGGVCLTARKNAIEQVGLLDEGYYIYTEETDWCRRFKDAGWLVMHAPDVVITHFGGQSANQVKPQMRVELAKSKARFIEKYHSPRKARIYLGMLETAVNVKLMMLHAASVFKRSGLSEQIRYYADVREKFESLRRVLRQAQDEE